MNERQRVYLGGPMRGKPLYNGQMFLAVAKRLRDMGYDVESPWEKDVATGMNPSQSLESQDFDLSWAFSWDFRTIMECDGVVVLPGWQESKGVAAELVVAFHTGKPVWEFSPDGLKLLALDVPKIETSWSYA